MSCKELSFQQQKQTREKSILMMVEKKIYTYIDLIFEDSKNMISIFRQSEWCKKINEHLKSAHFE